MGRPKRAILVGLAVVVAMAGPAFSYGRQIKFDPDDSRSALDLKRVTLRYVGGKVVATMSTHEPWKVRDITTVARAGEHNFYLIFDTSGDFRADNYVGVYREASRLVGIIREFDGARVGDRLGQVPVSKDGHRISFRLGGGRIGVHGDRIHWTANSKDQRTCPNLCIDSVPNERWAVYRF